MPMAPGLGTSPLSATTTARRHQIAALRERGSFEAREATEQTGPSKPFPDPPLRSDLYRACLGTGFGIQSAVEVRRTTTDRCAQGNASRDGMLRLARPSERHWNQRPRWPARVARDPSSGEGRQVLARNRRTLGIHRDAGFGRGEHRSLLTAPRLELANLTRLLGSIASAHRGETGRAVFRVSSRCETNPRLRRVHLLSLRSRATEHKFKRPSRRRSSSRSREPQSTRGRSSTLLRRRPTFFAVT